MKPRYDYVLIAVEKEPEKIGSIIIPDAYREKQQQGLVVDVGPGLVKDGQRQPVDLHKGDVVLFNKYGGVDVEVDGVPMLLVKDSDVIAVLRSVRVIDDGVLEEVAMIDGRAHLGIRTKGVA